jgi:hypothetical protein
MMELDLTVVNEEPFDWSERPAEALERIHGRATYQTCKEGVQ